MNIKEILDKQLKGVANILKDIIKIGDFYYKEDKSETNAKIYKLLNTKLLEPIFTISDVGTIEINNIILCDLEEYNQNLVFAIEDLLNSEDFINHIDFLLNHFVIEDDNNSKQGSRLVDKDYLLRTLRGSFLNIISDFSLDNDNDIIITIRDSAEQAYSYNVYTDEIIDLVTGESIDTKFTMDGREYNLITLQVDVLMSSIFIPYNYITKFMYDMVLNIAEEWDLKVLYEGIVEKYSSKFLNFRLSNNFIYTDNLEHDFYMNLITEKDVPSDTDYPFEIGFNWDDSSFPTFRLKFLTSPDNSYNLFVTDVKDTLISYLAKNYTPEYYRELLKKIYNEYGYTEEDYINSDLRCAGDKFNKLVQNYFSDNYAPKSEVIKKPNLDINAITDVKIVALKYNGKLVAYRFKTNVGCFDIDKETAQSFGVSEYKVTKAITLNKCNNLLMSNSEMSGKKIIPDISSNSELCNKLFNLLFS